MLRSSLFVHRPTLSLLKCFPGPAPEPLPGARTVSALLPTYCIIRRNWKYSPFQLINEI
ncbi:hypothetical protein KNP414_05686 [Paenibacillus mucilaginosus KNP414]|uniref:Uncharacterized protein n=1 Tax=Paenibacillus mucilaginosus (strain KNP414) TaxID=1036673 RepID=F8FMN9_PAEMK|nr:hypothetical protein KNP414_05686 [Paenibacillus mucilaginosus KNP414]